MPELGRCGAEEAGLGSRGVATASSSIAIPLHRSQPPGRRSGGWGWGGVVSSPRCRRRCVCGVSARCPLRGGLLGGREGVGDSLGGGGGGEGCWFLTPSQPVQDTFLPEITAGGNLLMPLPSPFSFPPPPKPPTSHLLSDSITTGHRDLRLHCSSPPLSTVRLAHRTLFD